MGGNPVKKIGNLGEGGGSFKIKITYTCKNTPGCSGWPQPLASQLVMPTIWKKVEKEANNLVSIHEATARVTVAWTHARSHLVEEEKTELKLCFIEIKTRSPAQIMSSFSHSQ